MTMLLSLWAKTLRFSEGLFANAVHSYEDSEGQSYFYKSIDPEDFLLGIIVPVHSQPNLTEVNPLRCGDVLEQVNSRNPQVSVRNFLLTPTHLHTHEHTDRNEDRILQDSQAIPP